MSAPEAFLDGRVVLHCGDSRDVLRALPDASVHAVVTDPPYALVSIRKRFGAADAAPARDYSGENPRATGAYAHASAGFMGQAWDTGETAFAAEFWREVMRVLKPGGHVVAFGGTRTYHRMACAIEDAGFEIRDSIYWHYATGFPKSHNIARQLDAKEERCSCGAHLRGVRGRLGSSDKVSSGSQSHVLGIVQGGIAEAGSNGAAVTLQHAPDSSLLGVRKGEDGSARLAEGGGAADMFTALQWGPSRSGVGEARRQGSGSQDAREFCASGNEGTGEPGMERRRHASKEARQLCERPICALPGGFDLHGEGGRLRDGASAGDGAADRPAIAAGGMRAPSGSCAPEQLPDELGALAGQPEPQNGGAWPYCGRCGKPIVPDGLGTALKPATEPIALARKPLDGTVAANVLAHGTGALNIDGCRIDAPEGSVVRMAHAETGSKRGYDGGLKGGARTEPQTLGRWPANIVHDGSPEVVAAFPETSSGTGAIKRASAAGYQGNALGRESRAAGTPMIAHGDSGSAARFFYSAKADADDRLGSKHPTVKPMDLMQWLCRLVCPPGGVVLDPFAGTGTTGEAAWREGFSAVLIERETEYQADIRRRMSLCLSGPEERKREAIKARHGDLPAGPLFADGESR